MTSASSEWAQWIFSKITFLKSVHSKEKDEACLGFLEEIFIKSVHRGGVMPIPSITSIFKKIKINLKKFGQTQFTIQKFTKSKFTNFQFKNSKILIVLYFILMKIRLKWWVGMKFMDGTQLTWLPRFSATSMLCVSICYTVQLQCSLFFVWFFKLKS